MLIGRIDGATRVFGEAQDEYRNLPVRDVQTDAGNVMVSAWHPTPDELKRMQDGAPIYLHIYGKSHPPVLLSVGESPL